VCFVTPAPFRTRWKDSNLGQLKFHLLDSFEIVTSMAPISLKAPDRQVDLFVNFLKIKNFLLSEKILIQRNNICKFN
jgi:hypothetical protein